MAGDALEDDSKAGEIDSFIHSALLDNHHISVLTRLNVGEERREEAPPSSYPSSLSVHLLLPAFNTIY